MDDGTEILVTDILAIDIATVTGFARGRVGSTPVCGSFRFASRGSEDNAVFAACHRWIADILEPRPRPDIIIVEKMLSPEAKLGSTTTEVRDRLAGLQGIIRAVAVRRGISDIQEAGVQEVRKHFIGHGNLKRDKAKARVMAVCNALGWDAPDDNAGDAAALWHFACCLIDPTQATLVSPLFNKVLRCA